jgi:hypothetical protein
MNNQSESPDPAAVFACALSLWRECLRRSQSRRKVNLSECYNGGDEFMRVIMRAGARFEEWACGYIEFEALNHCWPYLLEERFGEACVAVKGITALHEFDDKDCLAVSLRLRLPVKAGGGLPIPVDVIAGNPTSASEFRQFRIQTMRECRDGNIEPFTAVDNPFDDRCGPPFFGFYGVCDDGLIEHIADFKNYDDALRLARKLVPGIQFPETPHSR